VFDPDKLRKLNHRYIQQAEVSRLCREVEPFLARRGIELDEAGRATLELAVPELVPRATTLEELANWAEPYLVDQPEIDPKAARKFLKPKNLPVLRRVHQLVAERGVEDLADMEQAFRDLAEELGLKLGGVAQPVRVALTGRTYSPGIFEVMAILGREQVLSRLERAMALIESPAS
jgi:glutamyl-tRNA synthetase